MGPLAELMTDPESPLMEFYPREFATDANGNRNKWEAVALIPFLDRKRLKEVLEEVMEDGAMTEAELRRNRRGEVHVFERERVEEIIFKSLGNVSFRFSKNGGKKV